MRHVVMGSGGLASAMAAKIKAAQYGTDDLWIVFADVKGNSLSPHAGEDEDAYRFLVESAANIYGVEYDPVCTPRDFAEWKLPQLVWLNEGRDIWQVFHDNRFLGNSRLANCSKFLKQIPCRRWLDRNCDPADTTIYVGIDWTESHRLPAIERAYLPFKAEAPLTESPYLFSPDEVKAAWVAEGVAIPRLYKAGFPHNNCGGFCVRAGQAQFELLLREHPARYAYHEAQEHDLRAYLGADVSILRDRSRGATTTLTLRRFRERIEDQPAMFDALDFGGCGCFVAPDLSGLDVLDFDTKEAI